MRPKRDSVKSVSYKVNLSLSSDDGVEDIADDNISVISGQTSVSEFDGLDREVEELDMVAEYTTGNASQQINIGNDSGEDNGSGIQDEIMSEVSIRSLQDAESDIVDFEEACDSDTDELYETFQTLLHDALVYELITMAPTDCLMELDSKSARSKNNNTGTNKKILSNMPLGIRLIVKDKKYPCMFSNCKKVFGSITAIDYHLTHQIHSLIDIYESNYALDNNVKEKHLQIREIEKKISSTRHPTKIQMTLYRSSPKGKDILILIAPEASDNAVKTCQSKSTYKSTHNHVEGHFPDVSMRATIPKRLVHEYTEASISDFELLTSPDAKNNSDSYSLKVEFTGENSVDEVALFEHIIDSKQSKTFINVGISVWAIEWAPFLPLNDIQYLAVGGYSDKNDHRKQGIRETLKNSDMKGVLQIWKVGSTVSLYALINHDFGCIYDLKWCPTGFNTNRIGFLAVTFGDGSLRILKIPLVSGQDTLHFKLKKCAFQARFEDTLFYKIAWHSDNILAIGCSNGYIASWDVNVYLNNDLPESYDDFPRFYSPVHNNYILDIKWARFNNSDIIVSSAYDGRMCATDINNPWLSHDLYRVSGVINSFDICDTEVVYSTSSNHISTMNPELNCPLHPKTMVHKSSMLCSHTSTVWVLFIDKSIGRSDYFPFVASGSSDGKLILSNARLSKTWIRKYGRQAKVFYKIEYILDSDILRFDDRSLKTVTIDRTTRFELYNSLVAVQKVSWNPNYSHRQWLASGGVGWMRIDSTYKSNKAFKK